MEGKPLHRRQGQAVFMAYFAAFFHFRGGYRMLTEYSGLFWCFTRRYTFFRRQKRHVQQISSTWGHH